MYETAGIYPAVFGFPAANLSNYVFKLYGLRKIQKYHSTTKWVIV